MCGRSAEKHGIVLVAVPRVPHQTGAEKQNVICEECNAGIRTFPVSADPEWIIAVMAHKSVHVRLGETLKALGGASADAGTLKFIANQADWKKRIRELRYLGWEIETYNRKLSEGGRVSSYYRLVKSRPWPEDPTGIIRRYERDRAERNRGE